MPSSNATSRRSGFTKTAASPRPRPADFVEKIRVNPGNYVDSKRFAVREYTDAQYDEEIGRIFIDSDLRKLWNIIQDGFIESWDYSNFSEYGTIAVGTLIR